MLIVLFNWTGLECCESYGCWKCWWIYICQTAFNHKKWPKFFLQKTATLIKKSCINIPFGDIMFSCKYDGSIIECMLDITINIDM